MNDKPPLGLPVGTVRAVLAIAVVLTVCVMTALGKPISEQFMGLALAVFACYFTGRNNAPPTAGAPVGPAPTIVVVPSPAELQSHPIPPPATPNP